MTAELLGPAGVPSALPAAPDVEPVPVDQIPEPEQTAFTRITAAREGSKRPLVVEWLRRADERTAILRWAVGYSGHVVLFHLLRVPLYQWRLTRRAPAGAWRVARGLFEVLTDLEARPLRRSAVDRDDTKDYLALTRERNARIRRRGIIAAVCAVPVVALLLVVWLLAAGPGPEPAPGVEPPTVVAAFLTMSPGRVLILLVVVGVLGYVGRRQDAELLSKATVPAHIAPVLRRDAVELALRALPIPEMRKALTIEFPVPIIRDGPGYLARINLPLGVTPDKVMSLRRELASALRRPLGCVWPAAGEEHGGMLNLWVGYQDIATARQPPYPLLERGVADVFTALPYGTDQRTRKVGVTLIENNVLVGAMPGQGKTQQLRVLLLGAALDATVELRIHELKGSGDLGALEQVAHSYGSGQDDETIRACLDDLKAVRAEIERRAAVVKKIAKAHPELCPNSKVTRELANRRDLGLHPLLVAIDEVQNLYTHETYGGEAAKLVLNIIRLGRAFGVILAQATQRPDADSLPKAISANAGIRICLRVMGWRENDMVLGDGMNNNGVSAQIFGPKDKGVGYVVGIADDPVVAKGYLITNPVAERIAARARRLREDTDRLTGYAAGIVTEQAEQRTAGFDLLVDVRTVMVDQGLTWMWNAAAAGALAVLRPEVYSGLTAEVLGKMLAARKVPTEQKNRTDPVDGTRRNLTGFELVDVVAQMGDRPLSLVK